MKQTILFCGKACICLFLLTIFNTNTHAEDKKSKRLKLLVKKEEKGEKADDAPDGGDNTGIAKKEFAIKEVVVTGQYAPGNAEKAVQKIKIIDSKKIQAMCAQNLRDILGNELNVRLSQDNILGSSLKVQGIGGEGVKILIDGIPVIGRQDGNIDLSQINLNNIDRVEIIEGPMSVNYGTDALAGTINLITKKTQQHLWEAGLSTYYETIGTYNINGRLGFHKGRHTLTLTGGRNFFGGWNEGQPMFPSFKAALADSNRVYQWKPKTQYMGGLQYAYQLGKTTFNYKSDYFNEMIVNRGTPYAYGEKASDDYYHTIRFDNALFIKSDIAEDKYINFQVAYNDYKRIKNTYANDLTKLDKVLGAASDQDTSIFTLFNSRATFGTSKQDVKINYEAGYDINLETASGARIKDNKQAIGDYAAFASAEYKPVKQLTIRPGLRYAYNTDYAAPVMPSINVRYQINDITMRASFAQGFRAPSLKELYFDFHDSNHDIDGNQNLRAEYSNSYNIAINYIKREGRRTYRFDASGFYNDMHDRIELAQSGAGAQYTYVNIGRYKTLGVQANAELNYKQVKILIGGSYTGRYNDLSVTDKDVATFSYSPEVRCNVSYEFSKTGITANLFYKYNGSLPGFALDEKGNVTQTNIAAYSMGDLSVAKSFCNRHINVSIGSKNIFDVKNVTVVGAVADAGAHTASSTSTPIGTGRYYFVKLDFNFFGNK